MGRLIFHVDVNSAFLSWEAARRVARGEPDLRLIPSAVGGDPSKRTGIITAKSIPAKKYGITTGEPVAMALRKCPGLVLVRSDFDLYQRCSRAFKSICASYAPVMESFSIDEVFLDMTGTERIYPDPIATATEMKDRIRDELGFTVNVGIGENKLLAKMASDFEKPDKVHTLFLAEVPEKMWPLPVRDLLFLGRSSAEKLNHYGIYTIGQLARIPEPELKRILGEKAGHSLHLSANGISNSPVREKPEEAKGYSSETTFEEDVISLEGALPILRNLTDVVARRMRRDQKKCTCVSVTFRTTAFKNRSHQRKLYNPTDVSDELYDVVKQLFAESWKGEALRLLGVAFTDLTEEEFTQFSLFEAPADHEKKQKLDRALDAIKNRYGKNSVTRASTITTDDRIGRKAKAQMELDRAESESEPDNR